MTKYDPDTLDDHGSPSGSQRMRSLQEVAALDRTIHEPARLMIMILLYAIFEADFLYIQRECGFTQGNLASHLARLEESSYVLIEKSHKGKYPLTICSLTPKGRKALREYTQKMHIVIAGIG
jgi:DNA-binding MarR family transcriptional regulator